jgi:hypothetical protein
MKAIKVLVVLLSMTLVRITLADESQISISTTTNNTSKAWTRTDVYKRAGQRILEIKTTSKLDSSFWVCEQKIFWQGQVAVDVLTGSWDEHVEIVFHTIAQTDAISQLNKQGGIQQIVLAGTNLEIKAAFTFIAGRLVPVPDEEIQRSNAAVNDIRSTFDRFVQQEISGDKFLGEVDRLIKTYGPTNGYNNKAE